MCSDSGNESLVPPVNPLNVLIIRRSTSSQHLSTSNASETLSVPAVAVPHSPTFPVGMPPLSRTTVTKECRGLVRAASYSLLIESNGKRIQGDECKLPSITDEPPQFFSGVVPIPLNPNKRPNILPIIPIPRTPTPTFPSDVDFSIAVVYKGLGVYLAIRPPVTGDDKRTAIEVLDRAILNGDPNYIYKVTGIYELRPDSLFITYGLIDEATGEEIHMKVIKEWSAEGLWADEKWEEANGISDT